MNILSAGPTHFATFSNGMNGCEKGVACLEQLAGLQERYAIDARYIHPKKIHAFIRNPQLAETTRRFARTLPTVMATASLLSISTIGDRIRYQER
jgi:hypothetical protein